MATLPAIEYTTLAPGQTVGPAQHRFLLISKTADSLFGQLWHAQDLSVQGQPTVTLEFILPTLVSQSSAMEAIKRSVTYGKKLRHKHLTLLHGFFQSENQPVFLVAEQLNATTLASLLDSGKAQSLSPGQVKGLLLQIATALDTAYSSQHISHNSLCPACIYINRGHGVKLSGFATFPAQDYLESTRAHTQRYDLYQAPETHTGQNRNRTADIFSLACICYEVLTGHPPFATTQDRIQCDPLRLSQPSLLTEQQWQHLQMALSTEPKARPANAISLVKGIFQPDETETNSAPADNHNVEPSTDHSGEEAHEPLRLSEADLAPEAGPLDNSQPTTSETDSSTGSKRRLLPLVTFCTGLLIGYLASLLLTTSPPPAPAPADISVPTGPTSKAATEEPSSISASPHTEGTESSSEEDHVQATVSESEITSEPSSLTNTQTAVSLAAQLTESQAPRTLLFRDQITVDVYGPDMVALPSGRFQMGDNHAMGDDNEQPLHAVTIEHPFALSRYEVTFAQYDMFARATQRKLPSDEDWGRANRPVINISWLDAQAYTAWLAKQTGQPYRLPTEAEWEYAARAGTQTAFSWGNEPQSGFAVCDECSSDWGGSQTAPVGSQRPNAWGLYDMSGNVSEWVEDCYAPNYNGAPDNGAARQADGCHYRAMRGGSWFDIVRLMRPAGRYRHPASASQNDWGFRVALDLPEQFIKENN